jgi:hypothetical protein
VGGAQAFQHLVDIVDGLVHDLFHVSSTGLIGLGLLDVLSTCHAAAEVAMAYV